MTTEQRPGHPDWKVTGTDLEGFADVVPVLNESLLLPTDSASLLERLRPLADAHGYDRVLVAWDGERVVGTTDAFPRARCFQNRLNLRDLATRGKVGALDFRGFGSGVRFG